MLLWSASLRPDDVEMDSARCLLRWGWRGSGTYLCRENCDVLQVTDVRPQWSAGERSRRIKGTFSVALAESATLAVGTGAAGMSAGAAVAWSDPDGSRSESG